MKKALLILLVTAFGAVTVLSEYIDLPYQYQSECVNENYYHDEAQHKNGKCISDCECDGLRRCVQKFCEGKARSGECLSESYFYDEGQTGNKCSTNCECDGMRQCSSAGWCHGTARNYSDLD